MKKWIMGSLAILLGVMSISIPFAGIHTAEAKTTEETDKKLNIVTTIFPEYDWTRVILGDRADDVNLTMLLDNGTDLHSFQPAVKDIMKVSSCDLLIYVGGESDQWIEDALESAQNKDMKTINLMEVLGDSIKEEETVEGMQESDHDHDHEHHHDYEDYGHDHEHHHDHEDHDHDHEHHHEHDENCTCGCHDHEHHHHHHADEVFTSWGKETPHKFTKEKIEDVLKTLCETDDYGTILRAKGMVEDENGTWIYFDMVPGEYELRDGEPDYTGRLCVIGCNIDEHRLEELFGI